eukprot:GHVN01013456.1.p1 GENE.GHVN01013456.1~~GHVN01013456.1.p1  ORF type:complete len:476 (-),score=48.41 GHVN01013456.1:3403-4830(-)
MPEEGEGLMPQDASTLDPSKLTPLSPEVISRQATINFGTIGHVAHGKSTVVRAISGVQTVRFKNEKERNITIKLGYANAKIFKCQDPDCPRPGCYKSLPSSSPDEQICGQLRGEERCTSKMALLRHVSFVDCPGHDILMATMLNGAAVMDAALLLIAGNESCPQPQTLEHLAALEIMNLNHIIILQNKVELIASGQEMTQYEEIKSFVAGTAADNAPIIPISAVLKFNIDVICEYICTQVPVPIRNFTSSAQMIVIRSFDVNKPGDDGEDLVGGVAGGSILKGCLKLGDEIEIRPGIVTKGDSEKQRFAVRPIRSTIQSLLAEQNQLQYAVPGGLIGVGTKVDPMLTRADRLVGQVLGHPGGLPDVFSELDVNYYLLRRLLGVKSSDKGTAAKVEKLRKNEYLLVNVGSTSVGAQVKNVKEAEGANMVKLSITTTAVCTKEGDKVALSRRVQKNWRLIGWGEIMKGKSLKLHGQP